MKVFYGDTFIEREILLEAGIQHPIKLEYYKIINEDELTSKDRENYGIEIVKTEFLEDRVNVETKEVANITSDEAKQNNILRILKNNEVTPIGLNDVLQELLQLQVAEMEN